MPSTRWVLITEAAQDAGERQREALETLVERYLPALRAHLVINKRLPPEHAEDLLQSFLVSKVIERPWLRRADPARGRFRTFLLTSLDRFIISEARVANAQKRAPSPQVMSDLEDHVRQTQAMGQPSAAYDIAWARQVLADALRRMETACATAHRPAVWGVFERRLLGPLLEGSTPPPYAELVKQFGFDSPAQAANTLTTAKRMFSSVLRKVVGEYTDDPDQIERELRELTGILARVRP